MVRTWYEEAFILLRTDHNSEARILSCFSAVGSSPAQGPGPGVGTLNLPGFIPHSVSFGGIS